MLLLIGSFLAGMLTVLAPCVLPLLPVIIGGSLTGGKDPKRPYIIAASLAVSLTLFTLLLKATTVLIAIPPSTINYVSGGIIIVVGIFALFPDLYEKIISKLGIQTRSQRLLGKGTQNKNNIVGPIVIGAALGPVFSSCSPVYAYILATVLPASFGQAMSYIAAYVVGLSLMLLLIGILGQRFLRNITWAANPKGWFQRSMAILFILVGLLVFTNSARGVQTWVSENTPFDFDGLSAKLIPGAGPETNGDVLNVKTPYQAPEFKGLDNWVNSKPLTTADLKGKVTLIDFWTYSCINCIRTQPYLKGWYDTYGKDNFQVIGVHAPEFAFERVPANVKKAANDAGLKYPIALDNDFETWNNYGVRFWPTIFLVDTNGDIRRVHSGEGEYRQTEDGIRMLLRQAGKPVPEGRVTDAKSNVPVTSQQTPETYVGTKRSSNYVGPTRLFAGQTDAFMPAGTLQKNQWTLGGRWEVSSERITSVSNESALTFSFAAKEVYAVMSSDEARQVGVMLDGKPTSLTPYAGRDIKDSSVSVKDAKLYRLVSYPRFSQGELKLQVPAGVSVNVFTFGS